MRGDVARRSYEYVASCLRAHPVLVLLYAGFQHLISMKVRIFAHDRSHQGTNERPRRMPKREVASHNAASFVDLRLLIQGAQEFFEKFRSLGREIVQVASLSGQWSR